jgi:putative ABC transport system permease protein
MIEWKTEIRKRVSSLKLEPTREAEIVEELSQHLADHYAELLAGGATTEQAYRAALTELNETELIARELRRVERRVAAEPAVLGATKRNMIEDLARDLRYGARMLAKAPAFTVLATITLAIGIGANTAIFSGINAVLFKPLPAAREAQSLCNIGVDDESGLLTYGDYVELREHNRTLTDLCAFTKEYSEWRFEGQRLQLNGELVSGNYFQVLGVPAQLGRALGPEDDAAGVGSTVVLSDAAWRNRFAADPAIIGKQVIVENQDFTIVGVLTAGFQGTRLPSSVDYWMSIKRAAALKLYENISHTELTNCRFNLIGRLEPGITPRKAQEDLALIFTQLNKDRPQAPSPRSIVVTSVRGFAMSNRDLNEIYPVFALILGVVGLVLLIACANVASFLLARTMGRRKEIAVRVALGASRRRIVQMLLTESLLLALLGGAAALILTVWATELLSYVVSMAAKQGTLFNFSPDWNVFGAALLFSLLVGLVCGLVPAWHASKGDLTAALKDEMALRGSRFRRFSLRNALVVAQVTGSLVLLTGSGLFLRSAQQALRFDLGFESQNLAFTQIAIDRKRWSEAQSEQFFRNLQSRLESGVTALPGLQSFCLAEGAPLTGYQGEVSLRVANTDEMPFGDRKLEVLQVGPRFFATAGIPLVTGRDFTEREGPDDRNVVIINQALALRAFPDRNPLGEHLLFEPGGAPLEIIGIARDASHHELSDAAEPYLYRPISHYLGYRGSYLVLYVRTERDTSAIQPAVASLINSVDPEVSFRQYTMDESISRHALPSRMASAFFGLFGALGLLLAAVGLSGVLAYSVARRTKEIGVRMALGADPSDVLRMILGEGLALTLAGIVIGLLLALVLTRAVASFLYGVSALDPLTYLATTLLLVGVALLACYFPARRAARVDPMVALRRE